MTNHFDSDTLYLGEHNPSPLKVMSKNLKMVVSAIVSAVLVAVLSYITSVTDIYALSGHQILNIAVLTACASLLKAISTSDAGNFLGVVSVK